MVSAHLAAAERANDIGHGCFIISATSPFETNDLAELHSNAPAVVARHYPGYEEVFQRHGFSMLSRIDRVYVNAKAREQLGWSPRYDFSAVLAALKIGVFEGSDLARAIGSKGYHEKVFEDGPYPIE